MVITLLAALMIMAAYFLVLYGLLPCFIVWKFTI